ncbi:uroporphyrinogen decarboxylase [Cyclobacterium xiamenense]|jgi:uroporphyrinogen decarboxylase|uniref:uroporphyrinogen decarboxylase n=1 Tax=Cyclobacterium xiamenense TaxID=1297121 RepID=UPI0035D0B562
MQLKNDLLLRVIKGEAVERTPVWLMRQAGRILPEYRAVRASVSGFIELAQTPALAAEVTIQPVDLLGVDAAIIFSDILVVPEAMGLPYEMVEKRGPWFPKTIGSAADLKNLRVADPNTDLHYVLEAIRLTKKGLNGRVPLIGFAGAPWTIFAYMVEGSGSKTFSRARAMLYQNPVLAHKLLDLITKTTISYLKGQVAAGVNLVQVFDSWAGILSPDHYREFSLPYLQKICEAITEVPVTVFAKGAYFAMDDFAGMACDTVGLDWNMNIDEIKRKMNGRKALQGNLDPAALYAPDEALVAQTRAMLVRFAGSRHIANLGHGVYPDTSPEKVKLFIQTVKEFNTTAEN